MAVITEDKTSSTTSLQISEHKDHRKKKGCCGANNKRNKVQEENRRNRNDSGDFSDSSTSSSSPSTDDTGLGKARPRRRRERRRGANNKTGVTRQTDRCIEISEQEQVKYVAMDCEMVGVGEGGHRSALARVTVVDWHGKVVLDLYVRPGELVTDYRTYVSGISSCDLDRAVDPASCRIQVLKVLDGKILVGHGLKHDLAVLGISHPWWMTRDTAKWEPYQKVRFEDGILWPRKLKELCQEKLKREIQLVGQPHSPIEDAIAALDLYKLARTKWEKAIVYKVNKTNEIMGQQLGEKVEETNS